MLDNKSGNSNSGNRIDLLEKVFKNRVGLIVADREFIGHKWLKWMKNQGLTFCVRVPKTTIYIGLIAKLLKPKTLLNHFQMVRIWLIVW